MVKKIMTDSISQLISCLKNGCLAGKKEVVLPYSRMKEGILRILQKENYLEKVEIKGEKAKKVLVCSLKEKKDGKGIQQIKIVSKPGLRVYQKACGGKKVLGGLGLKIISTPKGLLTDKEAAKANVGGEIVLEVY